MIYLRFYIQITSFNTFYLFYRLIFAFFFLNRAEENDLEVKAVLAKYLRH